MGTKIHMEASFFMISYHRADITLYIPEKKNRR